MSDYMLYSDAKDAIKKLIESKEAEILSVEKEIIAMKKVSRLMDEEFSKNMDKKEVYIG